MATIVSETFGSSSTSAGGLIVEAFKSQSAAAATAVNTAITAASTNPGDPTNMIQMQVAMANYNIALQVQSSVIKSIEETAKSITQKL
jgi:type III secretion apparatus needle protein